MRGDVKRVVQEWLQGVLSREKYEEFIEPLLSGDKPTIDSSIFTEYFLEIDSLPENLFECADLDTTPFEQFFQLIIQDVMENREILAMIRLLSLTPISVRNRLVFLFLNSLEETRRRQISTTLPDCDATFIEVSKLMDSENTFVVGFSRLFRCTDEMSSEMCEFLTRKFRKSLTCEVCTQYIEELLVTLFPVKGGPLNYTGIDIFFSVFVDDFYSSNVLSTPVVIEALRALIIRTSDPTTELPVSFLKYLRLVNVTVALPESVLWSYVVQCPGLIFDYIGRETDSNQERIWREILARTTSLARERRTVFIQTQVFYSFLFAVAQKPHVLLHLLSEHVYVWFPRIVDSMRQFVGKSSVHCAFLGVFLAYCRLYESVAEHFVKSVDVTNFFSSFLHSGVSYGMVTDTFLWVLDPLRSFPFYGFARSAFTADYHQGFGYTFTCKISSVFISLLILTGLQNGQINNSVFQDLVQTAQGLIVSGNLLIPNEWRDTILHEMLGHMDKEFIHDFVMVCLAHFSCFYAFRDYYALIASDLPKVLDMIESLTRHAPIVDQYLWIDSQRPIPVPCFNRVVVMWVRLSHAERTCLWRMSNSNHTIEFYGGSDSFSVLVDNKLVQTMPAKNSIEGWRMVSFCVTKVSVVISVNLTTVEIPVDIGSPSIVIGDNHRGFDMQSLRVFGNDVDLRSIFIYGPNYQENLRQTMDMEPAAFFEKSSYISSYYLPFLEQLQSLETGKNTGFETLIFSLSAPFLPEEKFLMYERFLASLDAHGRFDLLIFLIAEVIVKHYDLQGRMFSALRSVIDKFPVLHQYFVTHKIYKLIGRLFWKNPVDPSTLFSGFISQIDSNVLILTNGQITHHWFLVASVYQKQFDGIVTNLANQLKVTSPVTAWNLEMIGKSNGFESIVEALSSNMGHSPPFLRALIDLALTLTDERNSEAHIQFVFKHLMVNHLTFCETSKQISVDDLTTGMLDLFYQLLTRYPKVHVPLEYMIPALHTTTSTSKSVLGELLLMKLSSEFMYILTLVLEHMEPSEALSRSLFSIAYTAATECVGRFELISCPLLFLATHSEGNEEIVAILSLHAVPALSSVTSFSPIDFENVLSVLFHCGAKLILDNTGITQLGKFIAAFFYKSVSLGYVSETMDLFIALFASKSTPDLETGTVSTAIMCHLVSLIDAKEVSGKIVSFLEFCMRYVGFVIDRATLEPGEIPEAMKVSLEEYVKLAVPIVVQVKSKRLTKRFVQLIPILAILDSDVKELIANSKGISKVHGFSEAVDRMYNPTSYPPTRLQNSSIRKRLGTLEALFETKLERDEESLFSIVCNSILYQSEVVASILPHHDTSTDIERWSRVFEAVHCPSSHVFDRIPVKYTLNSQTTRWEVRRILLPLNPSLSDIYSLFWTEKYRTEPPSPRLTLNDVIDSITTISAYDVKFTGDATLLSGLDLIHGLLAVHSDRINFSKKSSVKVISFKISDIKAIHLIPFQHQRRGIVIEENNGDSSLFAFGAHRLRAAFAELMEKHGVKVFKESIVLDSTNKWLKGEMSNFDYLMDINIKSGRTWSDFTQTPIFPWIVTSFDNDFGSLRDLSLPLFAQSKAQQKHCEFYAEGTGFNFPCFISNVGTALYYLVRMEPLTTGEISFMGGRFDAPARTFQSFETTLGFMMIPNCRTVQELVPEVYFMPEIFRNINEVAFHESISSVKLPPWAKSPHHFVRRMRKMLESKEVTEHLNEWIDLIWGVRRRGKLAEEKFNNIDSIVFEFNPSEYTDDSLLLKAKSDQLHNCGQAPKQLFKGFHPAKTYSDRSKEIVLVKSKLLRPRRRTSDLQLPNTMIRTSVLSNDEADVIDMARKFTGDYAPINVHSEGEWVLLVHTVPMISVWRRGTVTSILRGHMEFITSIHFQCAAGFAVAGHKDGKLSVFTVNPFKFVRVIDTGVDVPVSMTRISLSDSSIVVFHETDSGTTLVSLWSVNGDNLAENTIDGIVVDCAITSFAIGTSKNIAVCLMKGGNLLVMKVPSLRILDPAVDIAPNGCAISIEKNKIVVVQTERGSLLHWKLTHPK